MNFDQFICIILYSLVFLFFLQLIICATLENPHCLPPAQLSV